MWSSVRSSTAANRLKFTLQIGEVCMFDGLVGFQLLGSETEFSQLVECQLPQQELLACFVMFQVGGEELRHLFEDGELGHEFAIRLEGILLALPHANYNYLKMISPR
jgi:hypothetical protein